MKLSHSSVALYSQCPYCYYLKYIEGIRPKKLNSALFFGKAIDDAFNILLLEKDLEKAKSQFEKAWENLRGTPMKFRKAEIDLELINHYDTTDTRDNLEWLTLFYKGLLFIETYYKEVIPKIKKVITVQESFSFPNSEGDEINGIIDLIVEWEDGKHYLLDNKTSSYKYSKDDARESPQLSLYHYVINEKYKLDGIGFIVLNKNIKKNKTKTCRYCKTITDSKHKTCNNNIYDSGTGEPMRCEGDFIVKINPSVEISYIFDKIDPVFQSKVVDMFDEANTGISNNVFAKTHNPKWGPYGPCEYFHYTPTNPDFYKKEKKLDKIEKKE